MTTGLPSTIPSGSITVSGTSDLVVSSGAGSSQTPSSVASNSPSTGGNSGGSSSETTGGTSGGSSTTSVSDSGSATSQAAGSHIVPMLVEVSDKLFVRTFLAIAGVSFGAMVFL